VANRARLCFKLYYRTEDGDADRAEMFDLFAKALTKFPRWAVSQAFDDWEREGMRRPNPAEIGNFAALAAKTITDEIARRAKLTQAPEPQKVRISKASADEIMAEMGMTPERLRNVRGAPMASTIEEAQSKLSEPATKHWSETADPDGPAWTNLRAERAKNPLMNPKYKR
jgi:hypothetical protein